VPKFKKRKLRIKYFPWTSHKGPFGTECGAEIIFIRKKFQLYGNFGKKYIKKVLINDWTKYIY
jgi:hypothetical protein